jgi:ABC-type transporter Mla MlaB component
VGVRAEGTLVGEFGALLERECATALREFGAVDLDLAGVTYVDTSGLVVLQRLGCTQITISNCPPLIRELLEGEGAP